MRYEINITDKEIDEILSILTYNITFIREAIKKTPPNSDDLVSLCKLLEQNACERGKWESLINKVGW